MIYFFQLDAELFCIDNYADTYSCIIRNSCQDFSIYASKAQFPLQMAFFTFCYYLNLLYRVGTEGVSE